MFSSSKLIGVAGVLQAVVIAVGAYLAQPNDPTGRPLLIALVGVVLSAVVSFVTNKKVKAAVAREVSKQAAHP